MVEQFFNSSLYEVHQDALSDKYESVGFLLVMIRSINRYVNYYSKSKEKLFLFFGCLLETEILQDTHGIMSFRGELDVGTTG